jgi:hypothetical protein
MITTQSGAGFRRLRLGACISLSGKFSRFGRQAALGLETWHSLDDAADLVIEDDRSDLRTLERVMRRVSATCDVLLGPYSTHLMRAAGILAAEADRVIWNHGGAGDDVQAAHPGHVISVLTPASRYAEPFLRRLARSRAPGRLWITKGKGSFGRQVAAGAEATAHELGIDAIRIGSENNLPSDDHSPSWNLLSAGTFEDDIDTVRRALDLPKPPQILCAVAAGVREFGLAVHDHQGIFGIGQWVPRGGRTARLGPTEADFLSAYRDRVGAPPDYPAVQAAAAGVLAVHCARLAGDRTRELMWPVVSALDTTTLFGRVTSHVLVSHSDDTSLLSRERNSLRIGEVFDLL